MSLVLHVLRKDLYHLRALVLVWLLLLLAEITLIGSGLGTFADDARMQAIFRVIKQIVPVLQYIVLIALIPLAIQDDPVVGSTAFWLTRPVPGKTLLTGKAVFVVGLLVMPPVLAEIIILSFNGITLSDGARAVPEILMDWATFAIYILALAALTSSFGRFVIVGAILLVSYMLIGIVIYVFELYRRPEILRSAAYGLDSTREILSACVALLLGAILVANQYVTRRTIRSVVLAAAGLIITFAVGYSWPWSFFQRSISSLPLPIDPSPVSVSVQPGRRHVAEAPSIRPGDPAKRLVWGYLSVEAIPPEYVAEPTMTQARLEFPDGTIIQYPQKGDDVSDRDYSDYGVSDADGVQRLLGRIRLVNSELAPSNSRVLLRVDDQTYGRYRGLPGIYSGSARVNLMKYLVVAELPLQPRARYDRRSSHAVITAISRQTSGVLVFIRETNIRLLFAGAQHEDDTHVPNGRARRYVLRNRTRGEAFWAARDEPFSFDIDLFSKRLRQEAIQVGFTSISQKGVPLPEINDEWLAAADLVRVEARSVGRFAKSVRAEGFTIDPPQKPTVGKSTAPVGKLPGR